MNFKDYFQDELAYIKLLSEEFSDEYLVLSSLFEQLDSDPDSMKLFESFAFLSARLRQKIEDHFPEITQNLLSRVWPLPLRPLPATSILKLEPMDKSLVQNIVKGSKVKGSIQVNHQGALKKETCIFQLCRDIRLLPIRTKDLKVYHSSEGSNITLSFEWFGDPNQKFWQSGAIPVFLGSDIQIAGMLKLWFAQYLKRIVIFDENDKPVDINEIKIEVPKANQENCILPIEVDRFWRLQLVTEYFSLPHVNDFILLHFSQACETLFEKKAYFKIRFEFNRVLPESIKLSTEQFQLNCVPIINLFEESSQKKRVNSSDYLLEMNEGTHLHSLTRIYSPFIAGDQKNATEYLPINQFSSLHRQNKNWKRLFYALMWRKNVLDEPEAVMSLLDSNGNSVTEIENEYFFYDYICINDKKVNKLSIGDINESTADLPKQLIPTNITSVSKSVPPLLNGAAHWEIISYFSLSPLFLENKTTIQSFLNDFNFYNHVLRGNEKRLDKRLAGISNIKTKKIDYIIAGKPIRGLLLTLYLNNDYFVDEGEMFRLGCLIAEVFPFCIEKESFLKINIINENNQEIWQLEPIFGERSSL